MAAVLFGSAGLAWSTDGLRVFTAEGARRMEIAREQPQVPGMVLQTMSGDLEKLGNQPDKVTLIEFIYTTCPTICQSSGGEFAHLRDLLVEKDLPVRMMSVSFDPVADTLEALADYGALHEADGQYWTVARPQLPDLTEMLDFFRVTVIPDNWGGYQHNIAVLLINPEGRFSGVFNTDAYKEITEAVERASR